MFRLPRFPRPRFQVECSGFLLLAGALLSGCGGGEPAGDVATTSVLDQLSQGRIVMDAVDPGHPTCGALLGAGWYPAEGGKYAWSKQREAVLQLPVENTAARRLVLVGYGLGEADAPRRLEILVNGYSLGEHPLPRGAEATEWDVPPHRLRRGLNEITLRVDRVVSPAELGSSADERSLGVFVDWIGLLDAGDEPDVAAYESGAPAELGPGVWLAARLPHAAGASLQLAWSGDVAPRVRVASLPGGAPDFEATVAVSETGAGAVELPADLIPGSWLLVGGGAGNLTDAHLAARQRSEDVLLIIVDTLRPDFLGCYGADGDASPAIDALAADGILFENALSHIPITGPSHAGMFTSRFPSDTGILNNAGGAIPRELPTMAEVLGARGWDTRAAVSISTIDGRWQFGRGFATYDDRLGDTWILRADTMVTRVEALRSRQAPPRFLMAHFADPHEPYDAHGLIERHVEVVRDGEVIAVIPTSTYTPTRLDLDLPAGATEIVLRSADPFKLRNVGLRGEADVTLDHDAPPVARTPCTVTLTAEESAAVGLVLQISDLTDAAAPVEQRYAREVAFVDRHVGMILDALRADGRYDDTLIIFVADHGEALGEHGFLGHVQSLHDVMVRVPFIVKPRRTDGFAAGTRRTDQAALVDVLPTILGRLAIPPMVGARGRDLLADGAADEPTAIFMETHRPEADRDLYGLRTDRGKIVYEPATETWEYFDLAADPDELVDLASDGGAEVEEHRRLLLGLLAHFDLGAALGDHATEIDEHTAEMLRSLGY